jgi:hypothetical protein
MVSHIKRRGFTRIGCCGRYLDLSGREEQETEDNFKIRTFVICALQPVVIWECSLGG